MTTIRYEVCSAAGVTLQQFYSEARARKWLRERNAEPGRELPGAYVDSVETVVTRRRLWTPRMVTA